MSDAESDRPQPSHDFSESDIAGFMYVEDVRARVDETFERRYAQEPEAYEFARLIGESMALLLSLKTSGQQGTVAPGYEVFHRACTRLLFVFSNSANDTLRVEDLTLALNRAELYCVVPESPYSIAAALDELVISWCLTFFALQHKQSPAADFNPSARLWFAAQLAERKTLRQERGWAKEES